MRLWIASGISLRIVLRNLIRVHGEAPYVSDPHAGECCLLFRGIQNLMRIGAKSHDAIPKPIRSTHTIVKKLCSLFLRENPPFFLYKAVVP